MTGERWFRVAILVTAGAMLIQALSFRSGAKMVPLATSTIVITLVLLLFAKDAVTARRRPVAELRAAPVAAEPLIGIVADGADKGPAQVAVRAIEESPGHVGEQVEPDAPTARRRSMLMVLAALYPLVSILLGFTVGTGIFLLTALLYLGSRPWRAFLIAVGTAVLIWLFFIQLLHAPISDGLLLTLP